MSTVGKLFKIRNQAATFIQKYVKGCLARKDLKFLNKPRRNLLVRWRYNAREVFIIGDFTTP